MPPAPKKIRINVTQAHDVFVGQVFDWMAASKLFYSRNGQLCFLDQTDGTPSLRMLSKTDLDIALCRHIDWVKGAGKARAAVSTHLPSNLLSLLHASQLRPSLPEIIGVAHNPLLSVQGIPKFQPGYDKKSRVLALFDEVVFAPFSWKTVSMYEASEALVYINRELLTDFPFQSKADLAVADAALLTAVLRPLFEAAPMFVISARSKGTGKSYLSRIISLIASGAPARTLTWPTGEEEATRLILSSLRDAPAVIDFDNVTGRLEDYPTMCTCLTEGIFSSRQIRTSAILSVSTRTLFLANGNFVQPGGDLQRRAIPLLLSRPANPSSRSFRHRDLEQFVARHRPKLVSELLKIPAAYLQAGSPSVAIGTLPTYGHWCGLCCAPLVWLGMDNPVAPLFQALEDVSAEELERSEIAELLYDTFKSKDFCVKEVEQFMDTPGGQALRNALPSNFWRPSGMLDKHAFGSFLSDLSKQPPEGYAITCTQTRPFRIYWIAKTNVSV